MIGSWASFPNFLLRLVWRCTSKQTLHCKTRQRHRFQIGDFEVLSAIDAILEAFDLALSPWGGLKYAESEKCVKLGLQHLLNRRGGVEALMSPVSLKRAAGLAKVMSRCLCDLDRQIHVDVGPAELRRSMEKSLKWVQDSIEAGRPVVARLGGPKGRFNMIVGMGHGRFCFVGNAPLCTVASKDRFELYGLQYAGAFRVRVVRLEPTFRSEERVSIFGRKVEPHG